MQITRIHRTTDKPSNVSESDTERRNEHGSITQNEERGGHHEVVEGPGPGDQDHAEFYPGPDPQRGNPCGPGGVSKAGEHGPGL